MVQPEAPDLLTREIIGAAIEVHRALGPGLLESAYERCMQIELADRRLKCVCQLDVPVIFKGRSIEPAYRMDMLVEDRVVVEIKAVERILPVHEAQLLTYMRLASKPVGLLFNFHQPVLKDGIVRRVL